ncbi:DUF4404 family protein [Pseudomonas proteolytica]|uniref:DUF4404 family protein n=1 Tax=Pseudomonas proteolytica TaxID=219574 RepID=UPI0014728D2C|nr:DUF4404 family protein [Pseudomonas proteolytica]NMZ04918.1 DUF4404 family protein [Pseudomonas proteolytica]NMZ15329.1 DUF4404 family protein [Pseudomonas proteolytica]NMZ42888.1 DUF4404 family protein [Pseudomonas proteolytica]
MPARDQLQKQVDILREQLEKHPELPLEKREALEALIAKFEVQLQLEPATQPPSIADDLGLAANSFELEHPAIAGILRNIVVTLGNMGI